MQTSVNLDKSNGLEKVLKKGIKRPQPKLNIISKYNFNHGVGLIQKKLMILKILIYMKHTDMDIQDCQWNWFTCSTDCGNKEDTT